MRETAVLHLLFLSSLVSIAHIYGHISAEEAALHNREIAEAIVKVCDRELTLEDVRQEELLDIVT